ncbi:hypothetical protein [Streptomyces hydrogenans]|uniref:hypothetical protein n=1 Tax=Streptomyces hydrogenans TaxID=1873719 RepID=UPI0036E8C08D
MALQQTLALQQHPVLVPARQEVLSGEEPVRGPVARLRDTARHDAEGRAGEDVDVHAQ